MCCECVCIFTVDDSTRVRLKTTSGIGDYINSSHVDVSMDIIAVYK